MIIDKPNMLLTLKFVVWISLCLFVQGVQNHNHPNNKLCNEEGKLADDNRNGTNERSNEKEIMPYRSPNDFLGPKFPASSVINLCAVTLLVYADMVAEVKFDAKATKMCTAVCNQYHQIIIAEGSEEVVLMYSYCDYIGDTRGFGATDEQDLSTRCTCTYKVRCNQRTSMLVYTFQANHEGFLKVSITETNNTYEINR